MIIRRRRILGPRAGLSYLFGLPLGFSYFGRGFVGIDDAGNAVRVVSEVAGNVVRVASEVAGNAVRVVDEQAGNAIRVVDEQAGNAVRVVDEQAGNVVLGEEC